MIQVHRGNIPDRPIRGRPRKYPLDTMEVGDFFDVEETPGSNLYQVLHTCIRYFVRTECSETKCREFQINRWFKRNGVSVLKVTRIA